MTRIVGTQNRTEFILDSVEAWRRGRVLDQMLASARIPVERGVRRAPHHLFNGIDDARHGFLEHPADSSLDQVFHFLLMLSRFSPQSSLHPDIPTSTAYA